MEKSMWILATHIEDLGWNLMDDGREEELSLGRGHAKVYSRDAKCPYHKFTIAYFSSDASAWDVALPYKLRVQLLLFKFPTSS